jgi:hypothetical protein
LDDLDGVDDGRLVEAKVMRNARIEAIAGLHQRTA